MELYKLAHQVARQYQSIKILVIMSNINDDGIVKHKQYANGSIVDVTDKLPRKQYNRIFIIGERDNNFINKLKKNLIGDRKIIMYKNKPINLYKCNHNQ